MSGRLISVICMDVLVACDLTHLRDEHASCKHDMPALRVMKPTPADVKAPVVPTMISNHANVIPGFPTPHELPDRVAEAVSTAPVFYGEPIPYNTSRLPARSHFDSLLTAVNAVAQVDAPKPQGRNDSVVSYLDAQATAAEGNAQTLLDSEFGVQDVGYAVRCREQSPHVKTGRSRNFEASKQGYGLESCRRI